MTSCSVTPCDNVRKMEQWVAAVSHEVKNPLTAAKMAALLLRRKIEPESPLLSLVNTLNNSVNSMESIINDLLNSSSMREGKFSVQAEWIDSSTLEEQLRGTLEAIAARTRNTVTVSLKGMVFCDPTRFSQVITNLSNNALKFTDNGKVTVQGSSWGICGYRLTVTDTGNGISPEDLPRIFDKFWQAEGKNKAMGTGLGLSIVQGIIHAHLGRITIKSVFGKGSTFTVNLPHEGQNESIHGPWDTQVARVQNQNMRDLATRMRTNCEATKAANAETVRRYYELLERMQATPKALKLEDL